MKLLGLLQQGKRIINVDQSWVDKVDFRRRNWRPRGYWPSMALKDVSPRLSLFAAVYVVVWLRLS